MKIPAFQATQGYGLAKTALDTASAPKPSQPVEASAKSPDNAAFETIHALASSVAEGEKAATAYMTSGADAHSVIEAIAAAELAVETAVTIRDKVVEAYQELIRMPI